MKAGGGLKALKYSLNVANTIGFGNLFRTLSSKNTCKTCAYGMGGQKGGMTDEMGHKFEVCKKGIQAQITDIQNAIPNKIFKETSINDFKNTSSRNLEQLGRLNTPLYKGKDDTHYSPISWEESIEKITQKLKTIEPERSFYYSSGRSSNETAYLFQLFARIYGSNNIHNSSHYCHQASGAGISSGLGTGTATVWLEDVEKADLIFVIGANPSSNHPRFVRQLANCRDRGGNVIVINPVKEKGMVKFAIPSSIKSMAIGGSTIASDYIQLKIGGDIALLKGISKAVIEAGKHDLQFMEKHTNGKDDFLEDIQHTQWEDIVSSSGISKDKIKQIAEIYAKAENVIFSWALGITHHTHGVENVESIVNLALLRGMIGKRYAGLLPLRGHSNVQGVNSVGVVPNLNKTILNRMEDYFGIKLPTSVGMDTMSCVKAAHENKMDFAFLLGGNLFGASPDSQFAEKAFNNISFKVYANTTLNRGHFTGIDEEAIILPVYARDEEKQRTTQESMFNYIRMSDGGLSRLDNVRSETDIISDIAKKVLAESSINFDELIKHEKLRELISKTIPGYEKMANIDKTLEEFQVANRTYHTPYFSTPNHKANLRVCEIPSLKDMEFRMMTVRSEGQFNTVVYDEEDVYRGQTSRWVVLMNKEDIANKGLKENELVSLKTETGKMEKVVVREFDITKGNILTYFPESNILIPTTTDPRSLTPAFKSVGVEIIP